MPALQASRKPQEVPVFQAMRGCWFGRPSGRQQPGAHARCDLGLGDGVRGADDERLTRRVELVAGDRQRHVADGEAVEPRHRDAGSQGRRRVVAAARRAQPFVDSDGDAPALGQHRQLAAVHVGVQVQLVVAEREGRRRLFSLVRVVDPGVQLQADVLRQSRDVDRGREIQGGDDLLGARDLRVLVELVATDGGGELWSCEAQRVACEAHLRGGEAAPRKAELIALSERPFGRRAEHQRVVVAPAPFPGHLWRKADPGAGRVDHLAGSRKRRHRARESQLQRIGTARRLALETGALRSCDAHLVRHGARHGLIPAPAAVGGNRYEQQRAAGGAAAAWMSLQQASEAALQGAGAPPPRRRRPAQLAEQRTHGVRESCA